MPTIKGSKVWNSGKATGPMKFYEDKFPLEKICVIGSTYPRHSLKERILRHKLIEYKCAICKCKPVWQGKPLVLILDHINGVGDDSRLENLRFVCSNCDSQLPTYKNRRGKNGSYSENIKTIRKQYTC